MINMSGKGLIAVGVAVLLVAGGVVYVPSDASAQIAEREEVSCTVEFAETTPGDGCLPSVGSIPPIPPPPSCDSGAPCEVGFDLTCGDCTIQENFRLVEDPEHEIPGTALLTCEISTATYPFLDVDDMGICPLGTVVDSTTLTNSRNVPDNLIQDTIPVQAGTCELRVTATAGGFGVTDQLVYQGPCALPAGVDGGGFAIAV